MLVYILVATRTNGVSPVWRVQFGASSLVRPVWRVPVWRDPLWRDSTLARFLYMSYLFHKFMLVPYLGACEIHVSLKAN